MSFSHWLHRSAELCFLVFLSITLVFPVIFGWMKLLLLAYFAAAILIVDVMSKRPVLSVHKSVFVFMSALLCVNGFFVLRGLLNGASAEASVEVVLVYLFYPIFYLFLLFLAPSIIDLKKLAKVLIVVSIVISFLTVSQGLRVIGSDIVPGYSLLYFIYPGLASDYVDFAFTGVDGFLPRATERLIFLAPFAVGLLVARQALGLSRILVALNLLAVISATAFTGRRAILLIVVLATATLFARWFLRAPRRSAAVVGISMGILTLGIAGFSIMGLDSAASSRDTTGVTDYVAHEFGNVSFDLRSTQVEKIVSEAEKRPILGTGFGKGIAGYVRDQEHPWRVELTYIALLFQTGVLGITLYAFVTQRLAGVISAATKMAGLALLPFVFGMGGALLAAATNPYLNYGTGQWILFLPVAIFNAVLVRGVVGMAAGSKEFA